VDINKNAVANTKANAKLNKLKVQVICGDFYKTLIKTKVKPDVIVCNPPYVDIKDVDKKMFNYETKISFNNGSPLYFYEKIIDNYTQLINDKKHFLIAFEIGYDQRKSLTHLLTRNKLIKFSHFFKDFANKDRMLIIKK
jgi:release factor glutamine methyltransferase